MKQVKLFEQFISEAKQFGAKEIIKELGNRADWGDLADQVYMKSGNMVFVDTWFYGEERAMKQLEDSWKKGGDNYDYWNQEYGVDFKIVDTFSEIKAQGKHKKITKDGIVGVVLKVTPGKISESEEVLDEANKGKVHKAAKQGSYPAVVVVVQDGKVIHQETVSTPEVAPATFNVMQEKYPKALIHLEDKTGKRLFSESIVTEASKSNLKKGDKLKFTETGEIIFIIEPKGDGYDFKMASNPREKDHAPKDWFDMMIKRGKLVSESIVTEANLGTLKRFLHSFRMDHGKKAPSAQTLAQFIYDNYEDVIGSEFAGESDPADNYFIADIISHFKIDGKDFMIAWEDTVNANK